MRMRFLIVLSLFFTLTHVSAASVFFTDDFAGKTGRPEKGWTFDTTDASYWTLQNGWLNTGDGDDLITRDGYSFALIDTPGAAAWDDYRLACKFWMNQNDGNIALVGRWKNRENHYRAIIEITHDAQNMKLLKVVQGQTTALASAKIDPGSLGQSPLAQSDPKNALDFSLTLSGPDISAALNGRDVLKVSDADLSAGTAGLGQRRNEINFANIVVAQATPKTADSAPVAPVATGPIYSVRLFSEDDPAVAAALVRSLKAKGYQPFLVSQDNLRQVFIGRFSDRQQAVQMQQVMGLAEGFTFAMVVDISSSKNIAAAAQTTSAADTKALIDAFFKDLSWETLTPAQQQKVFDVAMERRKARNGLQASDYVLEMKNEVKKIVQENENKLTEMEKKIDVTANAGAGLQTEIEVLTKKVDNADSPSGIEDALKKEREREIAELLATAKDLTSANDLYRARDAWMALLRKAPNDNALVQEATTAIDNLKIAIDNRNRDELSLQATQGDNRVGFLMKAGGGAISVLSILLLLVFLGGRRRYSSLTRQLQQEAIDPLLALEARTRSFPGGVSPDSTLPFPEPTRSLAPPLLEETDASQADFMIPDKTEIPETSDSGFAPHMPMSFGAAQEDKTQADDSDAIGGFFFGAPEEEKEEEDEPESSPDGAGDDMVFIFADAREEKEKPISIGGAEEAASSDDGALDIGGMDFSFDSPVVDEPTGETITGIEIPEPDTGAGASAEEEEIIFSFEDIDENSNEESPLSIDAPGETVIEDTDEDSMYESIPLDDLNLDLSSDTDTQIIPTSPSGLGAADVNPLSLDGLDLDIGIGQDATIALPAALTNPLMDDAPAKTAESTALLLNQNFRSSAQGQMPEGWTGENTDAASLTVIDDPDGSGEPCLQFKKTAGGAASDFALSFADIRGRLCAEFDLRCDNKNKHLLGFYIECDADFRRSVHTVIQYTDPTKPAHLRIFTKPTPYEMGAWRRIKYIINLNEGMVDGYVNGELVAEGVRMGTKTAVLNTLSIRDNSETTATLLLKNLTISQVDDDE